MNNKLTYTTTSEAYLDLLKNIVENYENLSSPRGQLIREISNYIFEVKKPTSESIITNDLERNTIIKDYTIKEMEWYLSGFRSVESATKISKFWNKIANPDGTVNSNYGFLTMKDHSEGDGSYESYPNTLACDMSSFKRTPWEWAKQSLLNDKDSRQAVMRINKPYHAWIGNKDFPCTMHVSFSIRNENLNMTAVMRSNDVLRGTVYDVPFFVYLQNKMTLELLDKYPNLKTGSYTHIAHSMHMYEKDLSVILKMIG